MDKVGKLFLTKQSAQGPDAVQVGQVQGNLTIVQHATINQLIEPEVSKELKAEQSSVLRMLDRTRNRQAILDFMDRQFGTRKVIELQPSQLFRLRRYLETVHARNSARSNTA